MNYGIKVGQAIDCLEAVKSAKMAAQDVRDSAQWSELILRELRQQLGIDFDAGMAQLYGAVVNLREHLETSAGAD